MYWLDGFVTHWWKWYSHPSFALTIYHVLPILKLCSGGQLAQVCWGTVGVICGSECHGIWKCVWSLVDLSPGQCGATVHCGHCGHSPAAACSQQPRNQSQHTGCSQPTVTLLSHWSLPQQIKFIVYSLCFHPFSCLIECINQRWYSTANAF